MYFVIGSTNTVWQVWGTPDGENWSQAWEASSIQEGFEIIGAMAVFKNHLYLVLEDWVGENLASPRIMRTADGQNWETVAIADSGETYSTWFGIFTSFEGALYTVVGYDNEGVLTYHLWRSISGDPGTWEDVAQFPWPVAAFATFKGALYASSDWYDGGPAQVWRSFDGMGWEPVTEDGFGDPANINTANFGQKDGYLYVSLASFEGGGDIWRTKDGMHWKPVTTDGLGNPSNYGFGFVTYKKYLYAFSANDAQGVIAYRSKNGLNWQPANEPGWGDPANWAVLRDGARVTFKGKLYVAPYGPAGILRLAHP